MKYVGFLVLLIAVGVAGVIGGYQYKAQEQPTTEQCVQSVVKDAKTSISKMLND